jgi:hypothetical protein
MANYLGGPGSVTAEYHKQLLPHYQGNPLIEALPPTIPDEQLPHALLRLPQFDRGQRDWATPDRLQMLLTLGNFLFPLERHVKLARSIDAMMRSGYVGRRPHSREHANWIQKHYEGRAKGLSLSEVVDTSAQISALLMGVPGMGKTSFLKRYLSMIPQVIYHPATNIYQVTHLTVETPSDGKSVRALAGAILNELDRLIPGANYYKMYGNKGNADDRMREASRLMKHHFVGFLVAEEIQNIVGSAKGDQALIAQLVAASNEPAIPVLFVGTNKAARAFEIVNRLARRGTGNQVSPWERLRHDGENSEWLQFLTTLWAFQWIRNPVSLNEEFIDVMYDCSQGIIDCAIKLFSSAQAAAMYSGTETLTPEIIKEVYAEEMKLLHPSLNALRSNDFEQLLKFPDIEPIGIQDLLESVGNKAKGKSFSVKPSDPTFGKRIATALVASGIGNAEAIATPMRSSRKGKSKISWKGLRQH